MEFQRPTPKDLARRALQANQDHQYALAQHAEKLTAELAELDKLLSQADTEDGDSDLECDFYIPNAKPPVGPIRNFSHPESPFYEDTMKRNRYLNFIVRHTMPPKEVEALKMAVNAELRRVEQLEGASSKTTDAQMADKLNWAVVAEKVSDSSNITRTAQECRIKWIGDLSTAINRGAWPTSELQALQKILSSKSSQVNVNWVEIADELGTNRLPLDCMRQSLERPRHVWTTESDQKLMDAVEQYGTAWSLVAKYVGPQVMAGQCATRFLRTLDPSIRRGAWTSEEDERLAAAVLGYGKGAWADVASAIPGRTNEQCRDRWTHTLDPDKESKPEDWDEDKDKALIEAVEANGRKWKVIGIHLGRSATSCRLHYDYLKKQDLLPNLWEEDEVENPSARSTPKPRAKKVQQLVFVPSVYKPARPRPKPVAKDSSAAGSSRGTKRAISDPEDNAPRKKQVIQKANAVPDPQEEIQDSNSLPMELSCTHLVSNPEPTAADTSSPPPAKKGKRLVPETSSLPRRRSARLKAGGDGAEAQDTY